MDPTGNVNIINRLISKAKDKHLPLRNVKFHKHKHKKSQWVIKGIIKSISFRDKLHCKLKQSPVGPEQHNTLKTNLKTYQSILKILIRNAKKSYYERQFNKYKYDIRNTRGTIKHILNRDGSKQHLPDAFLIDNVKTSDLSIIANKFNSFFANIGIQLAGAVNNPENEKFKDYLLNPAAHNFLFDPISEETTIELLNNLKSKPTCGHDGISTKLLKACKNEICKPLTLIINQMLSTGIFPDTLKIAKVIPLFFKRRQFTTR